MKPQNPWIASVDSCVRNDLANLMEMSRTAQGWGRIAMKIDSGAVDTVMPPTMARRFPTEETERSKMGAGYLAANNSVIKHYGVKRMRGKSDSFRPMSMVAQVADVKSTLVSVHRLLEAGNRVHFESGNCYVEHVKSKVRTEIVENKAAFEVGVWVPRTQGNRASEAMMGVGNNWGFPRPDSEA